MRKSFSAFIKENTNTPGTLSIWDIDETLFRTKAQVHVVHNGTRVHSLSNQEFNTHSLAPGHEYDFSDFRSADIFHDTSEPIVPAIEKASKILKSLVNKPNSRMIIVTARGNFDDRDKFLYTLSKHGLDMNHIRVERAGNLNLPSAEGKRIIISKYLDTGKYNRVTLFDDDRKNLEVFLSLKSQYPNIKFEAYLANNGVMRKYR